MLITLLGCLFTSPVFANDAIAELGVGGIEFTKSESISMEEEKLFISMDKITVAYQFLNQLKETQTVTVAFPYPPEDELCWPPDPRPAEDLECEDANRIAKFDSNFRIWVNGKERHEPGSYEVKLLASPEQLKLLKKYKLDMKYGRDVFKRLTALKKEELAELKAAGLVEVDLESRYPRWKFQRIYYWKQKFPPGVTRISHEYAPMKGKMLQFLDRIEGGQSDLVKKFCIDDATLKGMKKFGHFVDYVKGTTDQLRTDDQYNVQYVLKTAKTWAGPIKKFHLTIEKPEPAAMTLISTCFPGIKKTGPRRFEAEHENFVPDADLDVLFYGRLDFPKSET
jgi:hypothetical protein